MPQVSSPANHPPSNASQILLSNFFSWFLLHPLLLTGNLAVAEPTASTSNRSRYGKVYGRVALGINLLRTVPQLHRVNASALHCDPMFKVFLF